MAVYLFVWNPTIWTTDEWPSWVETTRLGGSVHEPWSLGLRTKGVSPGDAAFLVRQHDRRGIVGSGTILSAAYEAAHFNDRRKRMHYVEIQWDALLDAAECLTVDELKLAVSEVSWDRLQASGVVVPDVAQDRLLGLWRAHLANLGRNLSDTPEQVHAGERFAEGAVTSVLVNRYERNPQARLACIAHWGLRCYVCEFDFEMKYGTLGRGYIHVHHLVELSTTGAEYEVDPIADMRPLCANCHAIVHRSRPAHDVDELKALLGE